MPHDTGTSLPAPPACPRNLQDPLSYHPLRNLSRNYLTPQVPADYSAGGAGISGRHPTTKAVRSDNPTITPPTPPVTSLRVPCPIHQYGPLWHATRQHSAMQAVSQTILRTQHDCIRSCGPLRRLPTQPSLSAQLPTHRWTLPKSDQPIHVG